MTEYTVAARNLALPYGTRFKCRPRFPIDAGAVCLLTIGRRLTIGDYYPNVAGCDWIVQPDRIIQVTGKVDIEIWGLVIPMEDPSADRATWTSLAAGIAIIEVYNLAMPLMT